MIRKAFVMKVNKGSEAEYKKRHDELWPEMKSLLENHGVHNYSIHLHPETNQLFAYAEIDSEEQWEAIAETEICQKWWQHMKDIMPTDQSGRPDSIPLEEQFYLE